jgi:hypothetical protein
LILFQIYALWFIEQKGQVNCLNNVCYVLILFDRFGFVFIVLFILLPKFQFYRIEYTFYFCLLRLN